MYNAPLVKVKTWAIAVAPVPPPPVIVTVGADVYPLPPLVTKMEDTALAVMVDVAVAWTPFVWLGAEIVTAGAEV
jgi:hypothetical protein